ncbi:hypothetical protein KKA69_00965 [Patescibacteria group bacterium]|nr:hypothetical protein [Patescibacteria group bacterium]
MPEKTATDKNYYSNLHSLIDYASSFLEGENRTQRIENSPEFQKINNQIKFLLINLGLLGIEEIESLDFKDSLDLLNKYLSSSEKDPGASIPPNLKELVENLNQKEKEETKREIERSLYELKKIARIKRVLVSQGAGQNVLQGKEDEIVGLLIEEEDLVAEIETINSNPQFTEEQREEGIQQAWVKTWKVILEETDLSSSQKKEAESLLFSTAVIEELTSEIKTISTQPKAREKVTEILSENFSGNENFSLPNPIAGKEEALAENLQIDEESLLLIDKIKNNPQLPEIQRTEQVEEVWKKEVWEKAIEKASLPEEIISRAINHDFSIETIESLTKEVTKSERDNGKIAAIVKESFRPLNQEQVKILNEVVVPNVAANAALAPSLEWKNVVLISFAQNAPELETKGFNPDQILSLNKKISGIAERNFPRNTIREDIPLLNPPLVVWNKSSSPLINLAPVKDNPQGNPFLLKDEQGKTIFEKSRIIFGRKLTPEISQKLKAEADEIVAFNWAVKGINPEAINQIIKNKQKQEQVLDSPLIRQIGNYSQKITSLQKQFPPNLVSLWKENRSRAISNILSKTSRPFRGIVANVKNRFFNTSFGKGIKIAIEKSAQKSLQGLFSSVKVGVRKAVTATTVKILSKIGLQAIANTVAPVIGGIVVLFGEKILAKGFKLIRGGIRRITGVFTAFNSAIAGLMGQDSSETDSKGLLIIFAVAVFIIIGLPLLVTLGIIGGAFVGEFGAIQEFTSEGRIDYGSLAEYQCENTRHFSEEVICKLSKGQSPCNNMYITSGTWNKVDQCFNEISLNNEDIIRQKFYYHTHTEEFDNRLQCLGFVLAIQDAIGQGFDKGLGYAGAYAEDPFPDNYQKIGPFETDIKTGDLAIWGGLPGHIAIVLEPPLPIPESLITVAEADGNTGKISLRKKGRPSVFLRYTGGN